MNRLTRDGTAEPVSRDQILRHAREQGNIHFPCSADHEQDWQLYSVDPYSAICDDYTYIHTYILYWSSKYFERCGESYLTAADVHTYSTLLTTAEMTTFFLYLNQCSTREPRTSLEHIKFHIMRSLTGRSVIALVITSYWYFRGKL